MNTAQNLQLSKKEVWKAYKALRPDTTVIYPKWYKPQTWKNNEWNFIALNVGIISLVFYVYCVNVMPS